MRSPSLSLRSRFLAAIAAGSALAGATAGGCGGAVEGVPGAGTTSSSSSGGSSSGGSSSGGSSSGGQTSPPAYVDASVPPSKPDASTACEWGKPQEACYTHAQLEAQYDSPWRGGDATDAPALTVGDEFQGIYPTVGGAIDAAAIEKAVENIGDQDWAGDHFASAEYRAHLARVYAKRALMHAAGLS